MTLAHKWIIRAGLFILVCLLMMEAFAQPVTDAFGQTIQINTRFRTFVGRPIWTLIIRDIDHNQNIPYLFDIESGLNHWVAFTYGRNYLITASRLQIERYKAHDNQFSNYRIKNFCNLESNGRIHRGESMLITIEGDLSPYSNTYTCHVITFPDGNFGINIP